MIDTESPRLHGRGELRLAGGLASVVALALLWIVSLVSPNVPFPPGAAADRFIRLTPGGVSTFFIEALGHWAMRLLGLGVLAVALVLGAEALARTAAGDRPRPFVAGSILAVGSAVAALLDPSDSISVWGVVAVNATALFVYAGSAASLHRVLTQDVEPDRARRRALRLGLGGALGLTVGGGALAWLARNLGGPNRNVALIEPAVRATIPPRSGFPEIAGLTPEVTTPEDHYVVDINLFKPSVEAGSWTLSIGGLVDRPMTLDFAELQERFEVVEEYAVLTCVSNEVGGNLVGHSRWGGVRLRDVLEAAGVRAGAVDVVFRAADGYEDSIPLDVARDESVLLTVSQNGEPLTQEHGFPCRVRVPAIYGMKNVKWITSIEIVDHDFKGYWQAGDGWSDTAEVRTQSRIDVAGENGRARAGSQTWIAGVAWAGARGVASVEVTTDGGRTWQQAEMREPVADLSWRQWAHRWTPREAGSAVVQCRATDAEGSTQSAESRPPHPAGATGYHTVTIEVS